jgi:hypothetical protein
LRTWWPANAIESAQRPAAKRARHCLWATDPDVVGDQCLEEGAGAAGISEHERAGHLDPAHRQLPPVAAGAILGVERRRDHDDPTVKERLHVAGAEAVAQCMQAVGLGGARKPVGERGEREPVPGGLALGPFVPIEPHLPGPRGIRAELDEPGTELRIKDVEVVDPDPPLLLKELKAHDARRL